MTGDKNEIENENESRDPRRSGMTTEAPTKKTETKTAPMHVWDPPIRPGFIPSTPPPELLTGEAAKIRRDLTETEALVKQHRADAEEARKELRSSEQMHRQAIADAVRAGEGMPEDPTPKVEARLVEAERMAEAFTIASRANYMDFGNAATDQAAKSLATTDKRVETLEAKLTKQAAELAETYRLAVVQRDLRAWWTTVELQRRNGSWSGDAAREARIKGTLLESGNILGVEFGGGA